MEEIMVCITNNEKIVYNLKNEKYYRYNKDLMEEKCENRYKIEKLKQMEEKYSWRKYGEERIYQKTIEAHSMRTCFNLDYGQTPALPESAVRRATLVNGSKVLVVGDDDLQCIPLALLGHEVMVVDIDEEIISVIENINKLFGLNIKTLQANILEYQKIEKKIQKKFDAFMCDPISTYEGFVKFIYNMFYFVKKEGYGYISVNTKMANVFIEFCKKNNITIEAHMKQFSNYYSYKLENISDTSDYFIISKKNRKDFIPNLKTCPMFDSQKEMYYVDIVEYYNVKKFDKTNIEKIMQILKKEIKKIQVIKVMNLTILYSDEINILFQWINSSDKLFIKMHLPIWMNSHYIQNIISKTIEYSEKRFEQFIGGIPELLETRELDVNHL